MKLTNITLLTIVNTLNKFNEATGKVGFAIAKNKRILTQELKDFDQTREGLIKKYGTESEEEPGKYLIKPEDQQAFNKQIEDILNLSIDVELYQLDSNDFEMPYAQEASVNDYDIIETFLVKREEQ